MDDQKWEKTQKRHFVGFERNIPSPHHLTLELAKKVAVDPLSLQKSNNQDQKIDCACFRHISISGFREIGNY